MFNHILQIYQPMKIAVTRLVEKSKGMHELFTRFGHQAILAPAMKTAPVDDTSSLDYLCDNVANGNIDFLLFSSTMGVKYFFDRCAGISHGTLMIAVGPKTSEAITMKGYSCETIASFSSDHFASHLGTRIKGKTAGIVRPDIPNPGLVESLRSLGAHVIEAAAYRLIPSGTDFKIALQDVEAVIFTSGKSFTLANVSKDSMTGKIVIAIGPKTADVMSRGGVIPDIVANGTLKSCLESLKHYSR